VITVIGPRDAGYRESDDF